MELKTHQVEGVAWLGDRPRSLLADNPGSGKTAQLILAAVEPVLVIAPSMLAGTWAGEVDKWRPGLDWTWTGYAGLAARQGRKCTPHPKPQFDQPWGTVICDEAHALKNSKANWTAALERVAWRSDRLFLATGTPIVNWAPELLQLLRLLYPGDARFTNKRRWWGQWFSMVHNRHSGFDEPGDFRQDRTWEQFWIDNGLGGPKGAALRREVELDVPVTFSNIDVEMTTMQAKVYKRLKKDYIAAIPVGEDGEVASVSAWSAGALHTKLHQASSGLETLEPETTGGSGKLTALEQILVDREGQPVVVFAHYRTSAAACARLATSLGRRVEVLQGGVAQPIRDDIVRRFQAGQVDVLVGTLDTISEGLTLTRASTAVFFEHSWRPSRNEQAWRRLARLGQQHPVHVIELWSAKTVDIGMRELVRAKADQQVAALSAADFVKFI